MISKIEIQNFQRHKKTELDLSEGLNIISGSSDQGKSSILRALQWCFLNEPRGFDFKRNGSRGAVIVKTTFTDGTWVERLRDSTTNQYTLFDGNKETVLKALGSGVPVEVLNLTRITNQNIQSQFSNFYLLNESAGQVASQLNEKVGLNIIDTSLSKVNSIIKKDKKDIEYKDEDYKDKKERLKEYETLGILDSRIQNIESRFEALSSLVAALDSINLVDRIETIEYKINILPVLDKSIIEKTKTLVAEYEQVLTFLQLNNIVERTEFITSQLYSISEMNYSYDDTDVLKEKINKVGELNNMCTDIIRLLSEHDRINDAFNETEDFLSCKGIYDRVKSSIDDYVEVENDAMWLERMIEKDRELTKGAERIFEVLNRHKKEYEEVKEEVGVCPVCQKPFNENGECC